MSIQGGEIDARFVVKGSDGLNFENAFAAYTSEALLPWSLALRISGIMADTILILSPELLAEHRYYNAVDLTRIPKPHFDDIENTIYMLKLSCSP